MSRRTLLAAILAIVTLVMIAGTDSASAQQNPNCCQYTVDIQGIPNACFPFRLATQWNCGAGPFTTISSYGTNGVVIIPLGPPVFNNCPPACRFLGASLDNVNFIPPGGSGEFQIGGCCYVLRVGFDGHGCVHIAVRPC